MGKGRNLKGYLGAVEQRFKDMEALKLGNKDIDWLALAISRLNGVRTAAKAIGVTSSILYVWLEEGLDGAAFGSVVKLSQLADVELRHLALRLGKFQGTPSVPLMVTHKANGQKK